MRLDIKALAIAFALIWGGMLLFVSLINLAAPDYGRPILAAAASIYPGFGGMAGLGGVIVVTLWGLVDGAIGGLIFGWLYNRFAGGASA